jgi:general secretion pathway protein A
MGRSEIVILPKGWKMYKEFYGFSEEPFTLTPDPRFFFLTESYKEVLDSLTYRIRERNGIVLITGEVGTGKTTFIHQLLPMLDPTIRPIPIYHPPESFDELLRVILAELNLPLGKRDGSSMTSQLNEYLYQKSTQEETLVIIVDEAQDLNKEIMEDLRLLCSPDPRRAKLIKEVLVGQPEIEENLKSVDLRQVNQRITVRHRLKPLSGEESRHYIENRLKMVGSSSFEIYTPEALSLICDHAKGSPRDIHLICYLTFCAGYALSKRKIDTPVVEKVISILGKQKPSMPQRIKTSIDGILDRNGPLDIKMSLSLLSYSLRFMRRMCKLIPRVIKGSLRKALEQEETIIKEGGKIKMKACENHYGSIVIFSRDVCPCCTVEKKLKNLAEKVEKTKAIMNKFK